MLKELQQLLGHLNFACQVVAPGRAFSCQFDAMKGFKASHHRFTLSVELKSDFRMWISFLAYFNDVTFWRDDIQADHLLHYGVYLKESGLVVSSIGGSFQCWLLPVRL